MTVFSALCFPSSVFGEEERKEQVEGRSPDGRTEIVLAAKADQYGSVDIDLKIREVKSGRVLGRFTFDGFSFARDSFSNFVFSPDDVTCMWRADSRCVALTYVMTRGFVGTTLYAAYGDQWVQMPVPEFDKKIVKMSRGAGEKRVVFMNSSHGHESGAQWLPHNRFRLQAGYGSIQKTTGDEEVGFLVTFQIINGTAKAKPRMVLEKVQFDPRHAPESR